MSSLSQPTTLPSPSPSPSPLTWLLSFLLVGMAWGLTTPFIRLGALSFSPPPHPSTTSPRTSPLVRKILKAGFAVFDLLRSPRYAIPLLINLTGSVWFFVLVGKAELSLTVPITNSLAFLFTVLGEWWAEGKVISRDTWIGMAFVMGGIALCVQSKNG